MPANLIQPQAGDNVITVDPVQMGWGHLEFRVRRLAAGQRVDFDTEGRETAIIPMSGTAIADVGDARYDLKRRGTFDEAGCLLYAPPGVPLTVTVTDDFEMASGSAPAVRGYPARLITPGDVEVEIRGGGAARRQVNHLLAPPLQAERLIVYEVFVPGGSWAGWPPHRHDGANGSPYLEETYFFQFDRPDGFGFHRNYDGMGYDEAFTVRHNECVAVPRGFHVTTATPGNNMWILNFLAGDLIGDDRAAAPYFDPATTWIRQDWSRGQIELPLSYAPGGPSR